MIGLIRTVSALHRERYGGEPLIAIAPGRVNLIGEHTDYNDGFVLPMAIDRYTAVAATARDDDEIRAFSTAFADEAAFSLADERIEQPREWQSYLKSIAFSLLDARVALSGADLTIASDVPLGSGLSSSASFEMAAGSALAAVSDTSVDPVDLALAGQRGEHRYVGIRCGIMDQLVVSTAEAGHAMLIDCRTLQSRALPLAPHWGVAVCDSLVRRELAGSAYNERRDDCEKAAQVFGVRALRDLTRAELEAGAKNLEPRVLRRALHVVDENERTLQAAQALENGDAFGFGELMTSSHGSLRDLYEVSTPELDELTALCLDVPGVFGARLTGGGFGGSVIALLERSAMDALKTRLAMAYYAPREETPAIFAVEPAAGVRFVSNP